MKHPNNRKKTIHTGGQQTRGLPFQGEMMTCTFCGQQKKSDPKIESGWTMIQADEVAVTICTTCWPPGDGEAAKLCTHLATMWAMATKAGRTLPGETINDFTERTGWL